jgi:hypothetical protein
VVAVALHGDFGVILGEETYVPSEVLSKMSHIIKKSGNISDDITTQCGSDGIRTRDLHCDRVAC